jgi:hypothetical protein
MDARRRPKVWGLLLLSLLASSTVTANDIDPVRRLPGVDEPAIRAASSREEPFLLPEPSYDPLVRPTSGVSPCLPIAPPEPPACLPEKAVPQCVLPECQWAGYKNGFFIKSCDGNNLLRIQGGIQFRYHANWRDADGPNDNFEGGFTLHRVPLVFMGNFITQKLGYYILLDPSHATGNMYVEEVTGSYAFNETWMISAGRFRNPAFLREIDVSFSRQLCMDRSYLAAIFGIGVCEGVYVTRQTDFTRTNFSINDGRNSGATTGSTDFPDDSSDIALTFGTDFKLCGDWAQYGDFTSWPDQDWGLFVGTGFHWEEGETGDDVPLHNANNFVAWTVDATLEGHGLSLFVAGVGRHATDDQQDLDQYGFLAQLGYQIVPEKWEPYARYEYVNFDHLTGIGGVPVLDNNLSLITVGVNRYFARHAAKITVEGIYAANPVPLTITKMGLLEDPLPGQVVLRSQLQLFF